MREIKFRAYIKRDKKIIDVKSIHFGTRKIIVGFSKNKTCYGNYSVDFNNIELMQFTGLKDKNGVEIYEGDIVKGKDDSEFNEIIGTIEWIDNWAHFVIETNQGHYDFIDFRCNGLEVIRKYI